MLDIKDLNAFYGKSHILRGVNLNIEKGEIVSLLGRNGVGRSTLVKAIMGLVQPQGSIKFLGEEISGMPSHTIALKGIGYVPENRDIFPTLTVRENLLLGVKDTKAKGQWDLNELFMKSLLIGKKLLLHQHEQRLPLGLVRVVKLQN